MKRALGLVLIGLIFLAGYTWQAARATITCTLPFTLQNNTTADANQVMANYNALVTCFTLAASAGINSDITSLTGLSTPLPAASGGTQMYVGGVSTGSANAQVVATTTPANFTLVVGKKVTFIAGFSNTDAMTLNVNGTGAKNVFRRTQLGASLTVGGEIVSAQQVEVTYDGTEYQLTSTPPVLVGEVRDYAGPLPAPAGWLAPDGSAVSRSTYVLLFTVIGTNFGVGDGSTTFNLPDLRGRAPFAPDNMGTPAGAANRLTNAGSSCTATLGTGCGAENRTVAQANLPNVTLTTTITDPGHTHTSPNTNVINNNAGGLTIGAGNPYGVVAVTVNSATTGITASTSLGGSGTALATTPPLQIVNKIIKY